jgi:hypothetical protein
MSVGIRLPMTVVPGSRVVVELAGAELTTVSLEDMVEFGV